jgi:hypothetical protein
MASFLEDKSRYIARTQMSTAGKANKSRDAEPSLWNLLGWDRDETSRPPVSSSNKRAAAEAAAAVAAANVDESNTWQSESAASFAYYAKAGSIARQFKPPVDPATIVQEQVEQRRRFSLVAEEAASKAATTENKDSSGSGSSSKCRASASTSAAVVSGAAKKGNRKTKNIRKRPKKKRAPKVAGPKAPFFAYGMNNTRGGVNRLQTHNVMPDDPREIYPNALHAAVRHPNAERAAMAIKKAEFLKSHQDSVSAAAEELLAALAKNAQEAEKELTAMKTRTIVTQQQTEQCGSSSETKEEHILVRRNQISNPATDPSLTMWDLMAWPGSTDISRIPTVDAAMATSEEDAKVAQEKEVVKRVGRKKTDLLPTRPSQVLVVERKTKVSPFGRRRITASAGGLRRITIEERDTYERFEPQTIEIVDPKSFANLSPAWTRNIPTAGKKSPPRVPISMA